MDLLPTDEQLDITAAVASLLEKELPAARRRELHRDTSPVDDRVWRACAELGWFSLGLPEELGGVGYGAAEEALLFREIGRHLSPGPSLPTLLSARVAARCDRQDVVAELTSGDAKAGLAIERPDGVLDVLDAVGADYVLFADEESASVVKLNALPPIVDLACTDPGVRLGRIEAPTEIASVVSVTSDVDPVHRRGALLAAAALVGISEATRDVASEYAKVREQFGRPIGVNQAIKHRCADMAVRAATAEAQLLFAAISFDDERVDAPFHVAAAKAVATEAAVTNAGEAIQIFGGMGYTSEHEANLYLKRSWVLDRCFGDRRHHLARLLTLSPS